MGERTICRQHQRSTWITSKNETWSLPPRRTSSRKLMPTTLLESRQRCITAKRTLVALHHRVKRVLSELLSNNSRSTYNQRTEYGQAKIGVRETVFACTQRIIWTCLRPLSWCTQPLTLTDPEVTLGRLEVIYAYCAWKRHAATWAAANRLYSVLVRKLYQMGSLGYWNSFSQWWNGYRKRAIPINSLWERCRDDFGM